MNKEDLKLERENAYDKWFDRFMKREEIEKKIEISNSKGYKNLSMYSLDYADSRHRIEDNLFIKKLENIFPDFKITKTEYVRLGLLGNRTGIKIIIDWGD